MWHISFMGNKKNQEFKNDVLPKNSKKITNNSFWINGKFFSFILIAIWFPKKAKKELWY